MIRQQLRINTSQDKEIKMDVVALIIGIAVLITSFFAFFVLCYIIKHKDKYSNDYKYRIFLLAFAGIGYLALSIWMLKTALQQH